MTQPQTLEQWLADEEEKQKTGNLEPDRDELIAQINQLNLELVQEKKVSQTLEEKLKKAEKELEKEKELVTILTNYRNRERKDELTNRKDGLINIFIILISIVIACIIHFSKQKEEEKKEQITNF